MTRNRKEPDQSGGLDERPIKGAVPILPSSSAAPPGETLRFITVRVAVYPDNSTVITIIIMDSK
jgi:hypothetical protein